MDASLPTEQALLDLQRTLYTSKNPTRRWLHCTRRDWIIGAIARHRPYVPVKALEIGPGSGIYLPTLAGAFETVVAADVELEFLNQARALSTSLPNLSVVQDDILASKLANASFDLVLCTEVIEHIKDSRAALANIYRALKPGGVLVLSTPQRYSMLELTCRIAFLPGVIDLVRRVYREPVIETGHVNLLTARAAREQIEGAGFVIKEASVGGLYLPGIAEFLGEFGLMIETVCERVLKRAGVTAPLWTQYYVATRPG